MNFDVMAARFGYRFQDLSVTFMTKWKAYETFRNHQYGYMYRFSFPNGYTASVIKLSGSYGCNENLWEIAVIKDEEIVYDTPITSDVLGWLDEDDVDKVMTDIMNLNENGGFDDGYERVSVQ